MSRRRLAACAAVYCLSLLASCATNSPPQQKERERKAADVALFRIHCSRDLWERTGGEDGIRAKVTEQANAWVTVELGGPNLVTFLERLDYSAHGLWDQHPLQLRMYNAIASSIDTIEAAPQPGAPVPEVTVNDNAGSPAATATPR